MFVKNSHETWCLHPSLYLHFSYHGDLRNKSVELVCRSSILQRCKGLPMGDGGKAPHTPKYLDQFLMVLLASFTIGLVFVRQVKQG